MIVASDLNGTLTTGSPVLAVARWVAENQPGNYPALFKWRTLFSYLQVKVGWKEIDIWGKEAMGNVLGLIKEATPPTLDTIMDYVVESELWPKRRNEPVDLLRDLHDQGGCLYIISAAYQPAVSKFAQKIAADRVSGIGTEIEITPAGLRLSGVFNSREVKIKSLWAAVGSDQLDVALGDTFADIPLLEQAKRPIAVYPDSRLKAKALERGWEIIS